MKRLILFIVGLALLSAQNNAKAQNEAKKLIEEVVQAAGGIEKLKSLKDVEYEYTFKSKEKGIKDN